MVCCSALQSGLFEVTAGRHIMLHNQNQGQRHSFHSSFHTFLDISPEQFVGLFSYKICIVL